MNLEALKDAVARWQTYEDRGIRPHRGWGQGGDGNSCALGDIAHYEKLFIDGWLEAPEKTVCEYLNWVIAPGASGYYVDGFGEVCYFDDYENKGGSHLMTLVWINDEQRRWPIEEVQRLIAWEEASIKADNIADVEQPIFV